MNGTTKVVLWALGILTACVIGLASYTAVAKASHGERIKGVEVRVDNLENKIDTKLGEILEAVRK